MIKLKFDVSSGRALKIFGNVMSVQDDDVKEKVLDIGQQIEADATKSDKGAVREATMANKPEDGEAQAGHILVRLKLSLSHHVEKICKMLLMVNSLLNINDFALNRCRVHSPLHGWYHHQYYITINIVLLV